MNTTNCKVGKLLLVETKQKPMINQLRITHCFGGNQKLSIQFKLYEESSLGPSNLIQPIIITDDEIKSGDWFLNITTGTIHKAGIIGVNIQSGKNFGDYHGKFECKKILVLPNQFSKEFLQAICDGKVKDRDKVEVETECNSSSGKEFGAKEYILKYFKLKLRKDGTAIIHPYVETVEEAAKRYAKTKVDGNKNHLMNPNNKDLYDFAVEDFKAGVEWQKNQKK